MWYYLFIQRNMKEISTSCEGVKMKSNTHPENYRDVAFKDTTSGAIFVIKSAVNTRDTIEHEGRTLDMFAIDSSSASHPFYTGNRSSVKSTGRVERFNRMFKK